MTNLYLKYNPYTVESEIKIDGVLVQTPNKLADLTHERLQVWIEKLVPILDEICNDDEYNIDFYGTNLDYSDLASTVNEYCEEHEDIRISINYIAAKGSEDRIKELIELFDDMQKNCPFPDLTTDQIKENFQSAISSEFEVSVIATMSSGKSTLINALLGRELMPSKNEACTATIAKIKDVDNMDHFEAIYLDENKRELGQYLNLTLENMSEMNDNPKTAYIDIKGDIPNISSQGVQLVLVDTPGPNNSRTEEHKNHTYRIIKEKSKPMVLYVLNATQLQTNDDKELLTAVSEAMKVGGKQSKDRFIFAVNKVDLFDPEKESVQSAINHVKEYLKKFNIENPNIFPTSAEMAKVIRMKECNQDLTSAQKRTLRDYDFFIDEEQLHLSEQATLSKSNLMKIKKDISDAQNSGDEYKEALIYTGIPAIEYAIDEYLQKYAYTTKVKTAVDTFRKKVEEKNMYAKMMQSIKNNEETRQVINDQLNILKRQLEEGASAKEFRKRINMLDMTEEANTRIAQLRKKITGALVNKNSADTMTTLEAQQLMMKLDTTVRNLQSDVRTELENIIEDVIINNAQQVIQEYRKRIQELIESGGLKTNEYTTDANLNFLTEDIPNAQELINSYKYSETYDTGETKTVANISKKWYKPWTWFQPSWYTEAVYAEREMVNYSTVYNDFVQPIIANFNENLDSAKQVAGGEGERFRKYFLAEIDGLEQKLKEKVNENEKLTRDQKSISKKIENEKANVEWLEKFMQQLENILAI